MGRHNEREKVRFQEYNDEYISAKYLDWDSNFFGVSSGKVILKQGLEGYDLPRVLELMRQFTFCTIQNTGNHPFNNAFIAGQTDAFLADINTQFAKTLKPTQGFEPSEPALLGQISDYYPKNEEIVEIAENAFVFSRFYNDEHITRLQARQLYANWVRNAFQKPNRFFITSMEKTRKVGFLLFSFETPDTIRIELLAVTDQYQNRSLGRRLMALLEEFARTRLVRQICVGTQVDNVPAINFYHKQGYMFRYGSPVYHLWSH